MDACWDGYRGGVWALAPLALENRVPLHSFEGEGERKCSTCRGDDEGRPLNITVKGEGLSHPSLSNPTSPAGTRTLAPPIHPTPSPYTSSNQNFHSTTGPTDSPKTHEIQRISSLLNPAIPPHDPDLLMSVK